jgi:hypothetical protein
VRRDKATIIQLSPAHTMTNLISSQSDTFAFCRMCVRNINNKTTPLTYFALDAAQQLCNYSAIWGCDLAFCGDTRIGFTSTERGRGMRTAFNCRLSYAALIITRTPSWVEGNNRFEKCFVCLIAICHTFWTLCSLPFPWTCFA